jgi:TolB-like protein
MTTFIFASQLLANEKSTIAILDIDPINISEEDGLIISNRLRIESAKFDSTLIVERQKMNEILREQGFQNSGCTELECAVEIGKLLNVKFLITGSIGKIDNLFTLSIRMIDVETAQITKIAKYDSYDRLSTLLISGIPAIVEQLFGLKSANSGVIYRKDMSFHQGDFFVKAIVGINNFNFTKDLNNEISKFNSFQSSRQAADEFNNYNYNFGIELSYLYSKDWDLKAGLIYSNQYKKWDYQLRDYFPLGTNNYLASLGFQKRYQVYNLYLGTNFHFHEFLYLGINFGATVLQVELKEIFKRLDKNEFGSEYSNKMFYGAFSDISLGIRYPFYSKLFFDFELLYHISTTINSSNQTTQIEYYSSDFESFVFPKRINTSGVFVRLGFGYELF